MATAKKTVKGNRIETLSAKAMSQAERAAGVSITSLEDPNALGKADILAALGWVIATRDEGYTGTYDEYADSHTLTEITTALGISD